MNDICEEGTPVELEEISRDYGGFADIVSVETKKTQKTILHEMHVDLPDGAITAILGPSGSGKTTLVNFLTDNMESSVRAVGKVHLPGATAFVPQDDRLHGFFTCKSYLQHYARLSGLSSKSITDDIDEILQVLGLTEQADTIVGDLFLKGLSGGQKRRLSVALEALTRPMNFFLDEPTSGLDAESALQLMDFLKDYARSAAGRRVILTIHQPSSFIWSLIDHVVLLSKGKLMYQGPRVEMENYFRFAGYPTPINYNPADHYVTAVNDEFRHHALSVDEWAEKHIAYSHQTEAKKFTFGGNRKTPSMVLAGRKPEISTNRSKSLPAALELIYRYFMNLWFNPGILGTRVAMSTALAFMVGAMFYGLENRTDFGSIQSRAAVLFYCAAFFIFMSIAILPFTMIERAIVDKEVRNGYYHPVFYQLAQGIASIPATAFLSVLLTAIIMGLTGLNEPYWYFLTMFLSLICAEALAQLVSHVAPHFIVAMAIVSALYGLFMLFQGYLLVPSQFPSWLRWTYDVAFHTYAWRTFMYSEFSGIESFDSPSFATGQSVLVYYGIENTSRGNDLIVLVVYGLVLQVLSFVMVSLRYTLFKGKIIAC